jgi:hypothetical protein
MRHKKKLALLSHSEGTKGYHRFFFRSNHQPSVRAMVRSGEIALNKRFQEVEIVEMACSHENGWFGCYVVVRETDKE